MVGNVLIAGVGFKVVPGRKKNIEVVGKVFIACGVAWTYAIDETVN